MQGLPNLSTALRLVVFFLILTNCFKTAGPAKTNNKGTNI